MEIINLGADEGLPPVDWAAVVEKLDAGSAPAPDAHNARTTWLTTINADGSAHVTPVGALRAVFPGGTITGCPKVRCMEIIAELEGTGRGAYTGSLGFLGRDGTLDSNILIRTMTASRGWLQFHVGGGIVADSDPETEYQETLTKARGMIKALQKDVL